jgi:MFS family permease
MDVPAVARNRVSYGWVIVAVSFVLLVGSFGTQLCFGLFLRPLADEFGWSRAAVSGSMSLLMAISGAVGVFMGRATDRWGARAAIAPGVVLGTVGYLLASRMEHLWQFYLCFGVGGGLLAGCSYTPAVTTVSQWFGPRRRTLAIGTTLLGPIVGQMVMSPLVSMVIGDSGWRTAWWVLAIVVVGTALPALVLMRRRPASADIAGAAAGGTSEGVPAGAGPELTTGQATRTGAFWILMFSGAMLGLTFYAFNAHIVSYGTDLGISADAAALIFTVSSVGGALGSLLAGTVTGRLGHKWSLALLTALNCVAIFLFIPAGVPWAFYVLGVLLGFAFSAAVPVRMAIIPPLFGSRAIGTIIGLASLSFSLGAVVGPYLTGYIYDSTKDYDLAFLIIGILLALGTASLFLMRGPKDLASERLAGIIA